MKRIESLLFAALVGGVLIGGGHALGQGNPVGPEFKVNTYTTNEQRYPSIASDSSGNFVVVWQSYRQDGYNYGVFGQRYSSSGAALGTEFLVNSYTTGAQVRPSIASDAAGNFVVVWTDSSSFFPEDGSFSGVFGQRYASSGAPLGGEFLVNSYTTNQQDQPSAASDSSGNFVVAWRSLQDGAGYGVFGQRYASSGAPLGPEFQVNTYTTDNQDLPSVASDSSGNFVVVWQSNTQDGSSSGVFGQRYASSGAPLGSEFQVNTVTAGTQLGPSIASDSAGNFVVVWYSPADGSGSGVFGQRYASSGAALGTEFRVNTYTTSSQFLPSVASDSSGNFVVTWSSNAQDGSNYGVFGQRHASSGAPLGAEFRVNTYTTRSQIRPVVASDPSGDFVVAWFSKTQDDGTYNGIFAQRYGKILPVELTRFTVE